VLEASLRWAVLWVSHLRDQAAVDSGL